MYKFCLIVVILFCSACLLPQPDTKEVAFISEVEQKVIQIVKEGNDYFRKGRYQEAENKYRKALYYFPEAENIKVNLVNTLIRSNLFEQAEQELKNLPVDEKYDLKLLEAYTSVLKKDYEKAIRLYQLILDNEEYELPLNYREQIYYNISVLQFMTGNEEQALCNAEEAYKIAKTPMQRSRFSRLKVAVGFKNIEIIDPNSVNARLLPEDLDYYLALAMAQYADQDYAAAYKTSSEILSNQIQSITPGPEFNVINYLAFQNQEGLEVEEDEFEDIDEKFASIFPEGAVSDTVALYWPYQVIEDVEKFLTTIE